MGPPVKLSTYVRNLALQPFSHYFGLASHTTHVVCINFIREWWDLQFNVDSERQIFFFFFFGQTFSQQIYLLSEFLPDICCVFITLNMKLVSRRSLIRSILALYSNPRKNISSVTDSLKVSVKNSECKKKSHEKLLNKQSICWITYIIGHYSPSVKISAQLLTILMLCELILYVSGGTYSLTSTPNERFLTNIFMAIVIHSQRFCQKSTF